MSGYNPLRDPMVRRLVALSDKELASRRPELRTMALERLEMLWQACEPHVVRRNTDMEGEPAPADYRYVDLGLRVMDRQIRLLRILSEDEPEVEAVVMGRDQNAVKASRDLDAIEARLRDRGESGG